MKFDKDKIKQQLNISQVEELLNELGGDPINHGNFLTCRTICHGGDSHKLYYYDNTKLFHCFTGCEPPSFDIFELVRKVKNLAKEYKIKYDENGKEVLVQWELYDAMQFVAVYFNIEAENEKFFQKRIELQDWEIFNKYEANNLEKQGQIIDLHIYDEDILKYLPRPRIKDWEDEGISAKVAAAANICYDPKMHGIVIPHYDINNNLIGIRERTLIKEQEQYGKYKPAILNGKMYNHPLGFNLYNINKTKDNIKQFKKAFIFESEKSCLKYASYFGLENDISVAICGNSLNNYQVSLLLSLGCKEAIIGLDKQFEKIGDDQWKRWVSKFYQIENKYGKYLQISFLFDIDDNLLKYKDSPIDEGMEIFYKLYQQRITITK